MQLRPHRIFNRKKTREIKVGKVSVGGKSLISVQSMTNTLTTDIKKTINQIHALEKSGADIVRVSCPDQASTLALKKIIKEVKTPIVADIHFTPNAAEIAATIVEKVRINPGLFVFERPDPNRTEFTDEEIKAIKEKIIQKFEPIVNTLKEQNKALRIGVNHGSLAERMLFAYGDTPFGMVESAMEFIRICDSLDFHNLSLIHI